MKSAKPNSRAVRPVLRLIDCEKQRLEAAQEKAMGILHALTALAAQQSLAGILVLYTADDGEHVVTSGRYESADATISALARAKLRFSQDQMDGNLV